MKIESAWEKALQELKNRRSLEANNRMILREQLSGCDQRISAYDDAIDIIGKYVEKPPQGSKT